MRWKAAILSVRHPAARPCGVEERLAVGASQFALAVLRVLGGNGIFVLTGVLAREGPVQIDSDLLMRNIVLENPVVVGSLNAGREDVLALAARGKPA